jgi:hypothetical protein
MSMMSHKRLPEDEADNSPTSSAKSKNSWIYTSTPPYAFVTRTWTTFFSDVHKRRRLPMSTQITSKTVMQYLNTALIAVTTAHNGKTAEFFS